MAQFSGVRSKVGKYLANYMPVTIVEKSIWLRVTYRLINSSDNSYDKSLLKIIIYKAYDLFKFQYKEINIKLSIDINLVKISQSNSHSNPTPECLLLSYLNNERIPIEDKKELWNSLEDNFLITNLFFVWGIRNRFLSDKEIISIKNQIFNEIEFAFKKAKSSYDSKDCINYVSYLNYDFFYRDISRDLYNKLTYNERKKIILSCLDYVNWKDSFPNKIIFEEAEKIIDSEISKKIYEIIKLRFDQKKPIEFFPQIVSLCLFISKIPADFFHLKLSDLNKDNPPNLNLRLAFIFYLREKIHNLNTPNKWRIRLWDVIESTEYDVYFIKFLSQLRLLSESYPRIEDHITNFITFCELEKYLKVLTEDLIFESLTTYSDISIFKEEEETLKWILNTFYEPEYFVYLKKLEQKSRKIDVTKAKRNFSSKYSKLLSIETFINVDERKYFKNTKFYVSADFRKGIYNNQKYKFTPKQSDILKVYYEEGLELAETYIMKKIGTENSQIKDTFKKSPNKDLIIHGYEPGSYRLNIK